VKVWFNGADWITRSLAKRSAAGGTIDNPGGGRFFEVLTEVLGPPVDSSEGLPGSEGSPRADLSNLAWMIDLC